MYWPSHEDLGDPDLVLYRDRAYLHFCSCPRQERRESWDRVLEYKQEIDRRQLERVSGI